MCIVSTSCGQSARKRQQFQGTSSRVVLTHASQHILTECHDVTAARTSLRYVFVTLERLHSNGREWAAAVFENGTLAQQKRCTRARTTCRATTVLRESMLSVCYVKWQANYRGTYVALIGVQKSGCAMHAVNLTKEANSLKTNRS